MRYPILGVLVALACAVPAQAHIESGAYLKGAYAGQAAFGNTSCAVHIHGSSFSEPEIYGWADPPNCYIGIKWQLQEPALCHTIVHEWGHLKGYGHSGDPFNVMYPRFWGYVYWRCQ